MNNTTEKKAFQDYSFSILICMNLEKIFQQINNLAIYCYLQIFCTIAVYKAGSRLFIKCFFSIIGNLYTAVNFNNLVCWHDFSANYLHQIKKFSWSKIELSSCCLPRIIIPDRAYKLAKSYVFRGVFAPLLLLIKLWNDFLWYNRLKPVLTLFISFTRQNFSFV